LSAEALQQYRQLCDRIGQKFAEIRAKHPEQFACRSGCHSCCKPGIGVGRLEKESLKEFLLSDPARVDEAIALENANPFEGKRCSFLRANGECLVYEARPFVCRSFGAPLQVQSLDDEEVRLRDVCELNFKGIDITQLPADDVLNSDTLNTLLALLTKRAFPGDKSRTRLELSSLLK